MNAKTTRILDSIIADVRCVTRANHTYRLALLAGKARWSGADLKGKASKYGACYAHSRRGLLTAIRARAAVYGYSVVFVGGTATTGPKTLALVRA